MKSHAGTCLCRAVTFDVTGDFERFYLCHCTYCRRDTGSAHAANLFSGSAVLTWHSGQDTVTQFTLPGTSTAMSRSGQMRICSFRVGPIGIVGWGAFLRMRSRRREGGGVGGMPGQEGS
jgi:hypothetical protein